MNLAARARSTLRSIIRRPAPAEDFGTLPLPNDKAIRMARCGNRDQVLEQTLHHGWEVFEAPLPRIFLDAVIRTPGLVIDVGANTGFYSLLAARFGRRVLAFEPAPAVRDILIQNIKANQFADVIQVSAAAVSDRHGRATLYQPDPSHGLIETSSSLEATFQKTVGSIEVDAAPLDSLLPPGPPAGQRVGVVKIDAEGHEGSVLRGAASMIARDQPVLFVEVLPAAEQAFMTRFIADLGYVDIPLRPDRKLSIETEVRFFPDGWNHAFVPRAAAAAILAA